MPLRWRLATLQSLRLGICVGWIGREVALKVEDVVNRTVHAEEALGGSQSYPDLAPIAWTWEEMPSGLDYPQRKLHETFLTVVT